MLTVIKAVKNGQVKSFWTDYNKRYGEVQRIQSDGYKVQSIETIRANPSKEVKRG